MGTEGTESPHCPHVFHMDCIVGWLTPCLSGTQHSVCPTCHQLVYSLLPSFALGEGEAHHDDVVTGAPLVVLIEVGPWVQFFPDVNDDIAIHEIPEFDDELEDEIDSNELQAMELIVGGWPSIVIPVKGYLCVYFQ